MTEEATKETPKTLREILGDPPYQIISMDGGGIYGLVTASMLRKLCDGDRNEPGQRFLEKKEEEKGKKRFYIFGGTSAGAINALLMARYENPREFIITGGLEAFWTKPGIYANQANPIDAWTSLFGLTGWLGYQDFQNLLTETFGSLTLGELQHKVMITAFNFSGNMNPVNGNRQWMPEPFSNFGPYAHNDFLVRDLAYAAAAPPGLRRVVRGLGDGGIFAPNPSDDILMTVISMIMSGDEPYLFNQTSFLGQGENDWEEYSYFLKRITMLSLGVGYRTPYYSFSDFDFGPLPFSILPTNLMQGYVWPATVSMMIDSASSATETRNRQVLGTHYHRLDPPILSPPKLPSTLVATAMARFDSWRHYLVAEIKKAMETEDARLFLKKASKFIDSEKWRNPSAGTIDKIGGITKLWDTFPRR